MLNKNNSISHSESVQKYYMHKNNRVRDFYLVRDIDFSFKQNTSKTKISSSQYLLYPLINRTNKFSSKLK